MHAIVDAASFEGRRKLIAQELGARAIRLNRFDNQPGQEGKEHDERESGQEEIYVPVEGSGFIRVGEEEIPLEPGRFVLVYAGRDAAGRRRPRGSGLRRRRRRDRRAMSFAREGSPQRMSKLRFNISMSLDGFVAGPDPSEQEPLGKRGEELHEWVFPLAAFREPHGEEGGEVNASTPVVEGWSENVGATIMGRNMFGGGPGPWGEPPWQGWWGDDPPFRRPVFVLTHHARDPLELREARRSTSSPTGSSPRSSRPGTPPAARTCRSPVAPTLPSSTSRQG